MENSISTHAVLPTAEQAGPADVGTLLKRHRLRARLTQTELADLSTVSLRTIRNLEAGRGRNPRPETVRLLGDGLRLGPGAFETLNTALGKGPRGASLSAYVSTAPAGPQLAGSHLIGRQAEVSSALGAIRSGSARVITLAGFGGAGKSRLALGIAEAARARFSTDWLWVPALAAAADDASGGATGPAWDDSSPADRFTQWAGEFATGAEAAVDDFVALVAAQPFLLVLDDLRHYGTELDALQADLLQRCPRLVIVETTRRIVEQANRVLMPVRPLALQGPADTGGHSGSGPALELLLEHARTTCPDLGPTGEQCDSFNAICAALDGLPRAIENAASWLGLCPAGQIAEMTASDPFTVGCGSTPANNGDHWAYDALADAINCLPAADCGWLECLSAAAEPWTLREAETMAQRDSLETARSIYESLALGLVRPVGPYESEPRAFTVLNHVKSFLA